MPKLQRITLTFDVYDDDMPSERRALYRQAAIDAMSEYHGRIKDMVKIRGAENVDTRVQLNSHLIDKMLEDRNR